MRNNYGSEFLGRLTDVQSILGIPRIDWTYLYFVFKRWFLRVYLFDIFLCTLMILEAPVLTSLCVGVATYISLLFNFIFVISFISLDSLLLVVLNYGFAYYWWIKVDSIITYEIGT